MLQHFMFDPSWDEGCPSCTASVEELSEGYLSHLRTGHKPPARYVEEGSFPRLQTAPGRSWASSSLLVTLAVGLLVIAAMPWWHR